MVYQTSSLDDNELSHVNSSVNATTDSSVKTFNSSTTDDEEVDERSIKNDHSPIKEDKPRKLHPYDNRNNKCSKLHVHREKNCNNVNRPNTNRSLFRTSFVRKFCTKRELKNAASGDNKDSTSSSKSGSLRDVISQQPPASIKVNKNMQQDSSIKGLFKLWAKKYNCDDNAMKSISELNKKKKSKNQEEAERKSIYVKKKKCRFTFFKKKIKDQEQEMEPIKDVTSEIPVKSDHDETESNYSEHHTETSKSSSVKQIQSQLEDNVAKISWVSKFQKNDCESNNVHVRWCNRKYIKRSNTVVDFMRNIYNDTDYLFESKSVIETDSRMKFCKITPTEDFLYQSVKAFVVHTTIKDKAVNGKKNLPVSLNNLQRYNKLKPSITRWKGVPKPTLPEKHKHITPKSSKIVQVCHCTGSNDYAGPFAEMNTNSVDLQVNYSDEEVFNIVEYENAEPKVIDSDVTEYQDVTTSMIDMDIVPCKIERIEKKDKSLNDVDQRQLIKNNDILVQCDDCNPKNTDKGIMTDLKKERAVLKDSRFSLIPSISRSNNKKRCKLAEMYMRGYWASMKTSCSSCGHSATSLDPGNNVVFQNMSVKRSSNIEESHFKSVEKIITDTLKKMVVKSLTSKYPHYASIEHTNSSEIKKRYDLLKKMHVMHFAEKFLIFIRGLVDDDEVLVNPSILHFKDQDKRPVEETKRDSPLKTINPANPKEKAHRIFKVVDRHSPLYRTGIAAKTVKPIPSMTSLTKDCFAPKKYYNTRSIAKSKLETVDDEKSCITSDTEFRKHFITEEYSVKRPYLDENLYPLSFSCPSLSRILFNSHSNINIRRNEKEFDHLPLNDKKIILVSSNFSIDVISPVGSLVKLMEKHKVIPKEKRRKTSPNHKENISVKKTKFKVNVETQFSTTNTLKINNTSTQTTARRPRQKNQRQMLKGKIKKLLKQKNSMSPIISSRCTRVSVGNDKKILKNDKIRSHSLLALYQNQGLQGILRFFGLTKKNKINNIERELKFQESAADTASEDLSIDLPTKSFSGQSWIINLDVPPPVMFSRSLDSIPSRKSKDFHLTTTNMSIAIQPPMDFSKIKSRITTQRQLDNETASHICLKSGYKLNDLRYRRFIDVSPVSKSRNPKYWTGMCSQKSLINNVINYPNTVHQDSILQPNIYLASYTNSSKSCITTDDENDDSNLKVIRLNSKELMIISAVEENKTEEQKENKMYLKVGNKNGKFYVERRERPATNGEMSIMNLASKIPQGKKLRKRKILVRNCNIKTDSSILSHDKVLDEKPSVKHDRSFQYVKDIDHYKNKANNAATKKKGKDEEIKKTLITKENKAVQKSIQDLKSKVTPNVVKNVIQKHKRRKKIENSHEISCGPSDRDYNNIIKQFYREFDTSSPTDIITNDHNNKITEDIIDTHKKVKIMHEDKIVEAKEPIKITDTDDKEQAKKIMVYLKFDVTAEAETNTMPSDIDIKIPHENNGINLIVNKNLDGKTSSQFDLPVKDDTDSRQRDNTHHRRGKHDNPENKSLLKQIGAQQKSWIKNQIITCDFAYEQLKAAKKNKTMNRNIEKFRDNSDKPTTSHNASGKTARRPKKSRQHIYNHRNYCVNNFNSKKYTETLEKGDDDYIFLIEDNDWINNDIEDNLNNYNASADLLQCYEAKEAVLQIYTKKITCCGKDKYVARLPKFERTSGLGCDAGNDKF